MAMNNGPFLEEWPRTMAYFTEMATGNGPFRNAENSGRDQAASQRGEHALPRGRSLRSSSSGSNRPLRRTNADRPAQIIGQTLLDHVRAVLT